MSQGHKVARSQSVLMLCDFVTLRFCDFKSVDLKITLNQKSVQIQFDL